LNFNIVDKSEAVKRGVEDKLGGKFGTGFLAQKVAAGVGKTNFDFDTFRKYFHVLTTFFFYLLGCSIRKFSGKNYF
jgi:hypothetical protein